MRPQQKEILDILAIQLYRSTTTIRTKLNIFHCMIFVFPIRFIVFYILLLDWSM